MSDGLLRCAACIVAVMVSPPATAYDGSSFGEIRDAVFSDPYDRLPQLEVNAASFGPKGGRAWTPTQNATGSNARPRGWMVASAATPATAPRTRCVIALRLARWPGTKTMSLHSPSAVAGGSVAVKPLTAARDGFSLNAAVACEAHQREKLERVCRYVATGPITLERLSVDGDGLVVYELKHPFRDGTTHVLFEPLEFIARLAASGSHARVPI